MVRTFLGSLRLYLARIRPATIISVDAPYESHLSLKLGGVPGPPVQNQDATKMRAPLYSSGWSPLIMHLLLHPASTSATFRVVNWEDPVAIVYQLGASSASCPRHRWLTRLVAVLEKMYHDIAFRGVYLYVLFISLA